METLYGICHVLQRVFLDIAFQRIRRTTRTRHTLLTIVLSAFGCSDPASSIVSLPVVTVRVTERLPWAALQGVSGTAATPSNGLHFVAVAAEVGLDFTYRNGAVGHQLMSEATGGGCGWLDFDRDGWWDLYVVQGGVADDDSNSPQPSDRLFRNVGGRFVDTSEVAQIDESRYGQGVAVGDLDNDGFDDVFVTNIGGNTLWQNQGDGTFLSRNDWSNLAWNGWSTSAAWADVDLDGNLDLYVCNYCNFDPHHPVICRNDKGEQIQCQPNRVSPQADHFYQNLGDGRFRECAAERGLMGEGNRALGVVVVDLLGDERPEIFVANDATANFLFVETSPGQYHDEAPQYEIGRAHV